jgi:hypothetical protein
MSETRFSLCPKCDACPEVVISDRIVTIGEEGNQVRLSAEEWNVLVAGVREGLIGSVSTEAPPPAGDCRCEGEAGCCA